MNLAETVWLAWRDWRHEWRATVCVVAGVAASVAPLLLLFAIRSGVVEGLRAELTRYPSSRELKTVGQPQVPWALVQALRRRKEVAFAAPSIRRLAASGVLRASFGEAGEGAAVDLAPSGPNDPLVAAAATPGAQPSVVGSGTAALSDQVARELRLRPGGTVRLIIDRVATTGQAQAEGVALKLVAILPAWAGERRLLLVDEDLLAAAETYREDPTVPDLATARGQALRSRGTRPYAGLRLYARTVEDVAPLQGFLSDRGVRVEGRLGEIRLVHDLDVALTTLFALMAAVSGLGLALSLGAAQWAWVDRRRRDLSYLRLVGLESAELALIPLAQSLLTSAAGVVVAAAVALGGGAVVNHLFAGRMNGVIEVSRLEPQHVLVASGLALATAAVASAAAMTAAHRVSPAIVLREGV